MTEMPIGERVAAMEVDLKNLNTKVDKLTDKIDLILGIVDRAKGVKWLLWAIGGWQNWPSE